MNWEGKLQEFEELIQLAMRQTRGWPNPQVNLSKQQAQLLYTLYNKGRITVSELAEQLYLSPSATTIAVNRLVRDNCIVRTRDETDRRLVWVEASEQAKVMIEEMRRHRNEILVKMLNNLTVQEVDQFLKLLRKMLDGLANSE